MTYLIVCEICQLFMNLLNLGEMDVGKQNSGICIRVPEINDVENVWSKIEEIHKNQQELLYYEDVSTNHTKETLKQLIKTGNEAERIWIACLDTEIVGLIDVMYQAPDYMFFDDKYVCVRYFHVDEGAEECSELLMDQVIQDARQYGFTYLCGDVLSEDAKMNSLFKSNQFEEYRIRLAKKL